MPSYVSAAGGFSFHLTMRFRMFFSLKPVLERFPFSRLFRGLFSLEDRRKCSRVPLASFVVNVLKAFSFNRRKKNTPISNPYSVEIIPLDILAPLYTYYANKKIKYQRPSGSNQLYEGQDYFVKFGRKMQYKIITSEGASHQLPLSDRTNNKM